jgi:hypothetical protein
MDNPTGISIVFSFVFSDNHQARDGMMTMMANMPYQLLLNSGVGFLNLSDSIQHF